jgi:hypothetical protein
MGPKNELENPSYNWKKVQNGNMLSWDKSEIIKTKARMIEEAAERKARYLKHAGDGYQDEKVNDMLIDALEAKLAILDGI